MSVRKRVWHREILYIGLALALIMSGFALTSAAKDPKDVNDVDLPLPYEEHVGFSIGIGIAAGSGSVGGGTSGGGGGGGTGGTGGGGTSSGFGSGSGSCCGGGGGGPSINDAVITSIEPANPRVGQMITIRGTGFRAFASGSSRVRFESGGRTFFANAPYVWRDTYIQVRVPVGKTLTSGSIKDIEAGLATVIIGNSLGLSASGFPIDILKDVPGTLSFQQRTAVIFGGTEVSGTLGNPFPSVAPWGTVSSSEDHNRARTKDAEVGDINADGWPDIFDNNSNNELFDTHGIIRYNNDGDGTFEANRFEPWDGSDVIGPFATLSNSTGDYFGDGVSYDADFIDLRNDGFPDLVQTATVNGVNTIRVYNNHWFAVGRFDFDIFFPSDFVGTTGGCPDDIAHGDMDGDGWVDFAVTFRNGGACTGLASDSETRLYWNDQSFFTSAVIFPNLLNSASVHDVFFFDADQDHRSDVFVVAESSQASALYLYNGSLSPPFEFEDRFSVDAFAGDPADLNGDGFVDFALAGTNLVRVYLNSRTNPGNFSSSNLPNDGSGAHYDVEMGDIDLDGDIDIVVATLTTSSTNTLRLYLNNGSGGFTESSSMIPGLASFQRLSADLIDYDLDGDLDLYITGQDSGTAPNQLWENLKR